MATEHEQAVGGQRKRLSIWRASATGANVLVLDEPAVGLDPGSLEALVELLRSHLERDGAIVFVSHQDALVDALRDVTCSVRVWDASQRNRHEVRAPGASAERWGRLEALSKLAGLAHVPRAWWARLFWVCMHVVFHPKFAAFFLLVGVMLGGSLGVTMTRLGSKFLDPALVLTRGALPALSFLAPPLAALLSAATVANSALSWSGQQRLLGSHDALEGLGIDTDRSIGQLLASSTWMCSLGIQVLFLGALVAGLILVSSWLGIPIAWGAQLLELLHDPRLGARILLYPLVLSVILGWHIHASVMHAADITHRTLTLTITTTLVVVCFESCSALLLS